MQNQPFSLALEVQSKPIVIKQGGVKVKNVNSNWFCLFFCNWDKKIKAYCHAPPFCGSVPRSSLSTWSANFPSTRPGMLCVSEVSFDQNLSSSC